MAKRMLRMRAHAARLGASALCRGRASPCAPGRQPGPRSRCDRRAFSRTDLRVKELTPRGAPHALGHYVAESSPAGAACCPLRRPARKQVRQARLGRGGLGGQQGRVGGADFSVLRGPRRTRCVPAASAWPAAAVSAGALPAALASAARGLTPRGALRTPHALGTRVAESSSADAAGTSGRQEVLLESGTASWLPAHLRAVPRWLRDFPPCKR
jgi:hypothetical protein